MVRLSAAFDEVLGEIVSAWEKMNFLQKLIVVNFLGVTAPMMEHALKNGESWRLLRPDAMALDNRTFVALAVQGMILKRGYRLETGVATALEETISQAEREASTEQERELCAWARSVQRNAVRLAITWAEITEASIGTFSSLLKAN